MRRQWVRDCRRLRGDLALGESNREATDEPPPAARRITPLTARGLVLFRKAMMRLLLMAVCAVFAELDVMDEEKAADRRYSLHTKRPALQTSSSNKKDTKTPRVKPSEATKTIPANLDDLRAIIEEGERRALEEERRFMPDPREVQRRALYFASLPRSEAKRHTRLVDRALKAKNYFALLGIGKRASVATIKKKYRQLALNVHPDRNPSPDAPAAFELLTEAHETLSDPKRRREYNRKLKRKTLIRRTRLKRQLKAVVQDTSALVAYRSRDRPLLFYGAFLLAFGLLFL